jgi:NodT family efflux transporter outer membrane factor (OMF) lipoprotein
MTFIFQQLTHIISFFSNLVHQWRRVVYVMVSVLCLSSCVGNPPQEQSELALKAVNTTLPSLEQSQMQWQDMHYLAADAKPWWQEFNDPVLHELVELTLDKSKDIGLAVARLDEAVATARGSRAGLFPTVNLDTQAGVSSTDLEEGGLQSNPDRVNTASANFVLAWQSDLFGQLRNLSAADKARLQGQSSRLRDIQRVIVGQVVQSYYRIVSTRKRIELTEISVDRRAENVERINQLLIQGYATALDQTRADSQLYEARAQLAQLELEEVTLLNQLSVLVGVDGVTMRHQVKMSGELIVPTKIAPLPSIPLLIQHRPDLRAVERDLVAAAYNVNASTAALYPTLGFRIELGKSPDGGLTGAFPALDVITGGILTNLAMPIFGRGRLLAAIDASSARLQQAHRTFELTALRVISELDTSIISIDKNRTIYEQRLLASQSAEEAAELSKELFKAGELDYTSVILAEQTRVSSETSAITAQQALLIAYITYLSAVAPAW